MVSRSCFAFPASYQCATEAMHRTTAGDAYICRHCNCTSGSPKCFPIIQKLPIREQRRARGFCLYLNRDCQETRVYIIFLFEEFDDI